MNKEKYLHYSLNAQAIVSDFFHGLSPFFTGDVKRLFFSYVNAHNRNNTLTYWQRSLINNSFEKKFYNKSYLAKFKNKFYDLYQLQKAWINAHNLLLNYYATSGKKIVEADGFFNINERIMGNHRQVYRSFFPEPMMPSFIEAFERLSIKSLNARSILGQPNRSLVFSTQPNPKPILSFTDSILFANSKELQNSNKLEEEKKREYKKRSIKPCSTKKTLAFN